MLISQSNLHVQENHICFLKFPQFVKDFPVEKALSSHFNETSFLWKYEGKNQPLSDHYLNLFAENVLKETRNV